MIKEAAIAFLREKKLLAEEKDQFLIVFDDEMTPSVELAELLEEFYDYCYKNHLL